MTFPATAYLAGPMRGIKEFNFPAFRRATQVLRHAGIYVVSPHEMDEAQGYDWTGFTGHEDLAQYNFDLTARLADDILAICEVEAVILLDGWMLSGGARAEASFAWATGRPVFEFEEGNRINGFTNSLTSYTKGIIIPCEVIGSRVEWEG